MQRALHEGVDLDAGDVRVIGLETRLRLPNGYVEELELLPVRYTVPGPGLHTLGRRAGDHRAYVARRSDYASAAVNAYKLALLSWYVFAGLLNVATIGKPVKVKTPAMAVVVLLILGVLAFLVVRA